MSGPIPGLPEKRCIFLFPGHLSLAFVGEPVSSRLLEEGNTPGLRLWAGLRAPTGGGCRGGRSETPCPVLGEKQGNALLSLQGYQGPHTLQCPPCLSPHIMRHPSLASLSRVPPHLRASPVPVSFKAKNRHTIRRTAHIFTAETHASLRLCFLKCTKEEEPSLPAPQAAETTE